MRCFFNYIGVCLHCPESVSEWQSHWNKHELFSDRKRDPVVKQSFREKTGISREKVNTSPSLFNDSPLTFHAFQLIFNDSLLILKAIPSFLQSWDNLGSPSRMRFHRRCLFPKLQGELILIMPFKSTLVTGIDDNVTIIPYRLPIHHQ